MVVPAGATGLKFVMSGGTGDADMYVKFGSAPTDTVYDCRPYASGNAETCTIATAQAGTYYINLKAYAAFSGVSLTGSYTTGATNTAPTANFTSSVSGLTATFTDSSTDPQGNGTITSRSWNFGDGTTSTATSPVKTYAAAGTYTVTETVTDSGGLTGTKSASVTVSSTSLRRHGVVQRHGGGPAVGRQGRSLVELHDRRPGRQDQRRVHHLRRHRRCGHVREARLRADQHQLRLPSVPVGQC